MKIAYQNKDCHKTQTGHWEVCTGCIFHKYDKINWLCELIPCECVGKELYIQTDELEEIFKV